MYRGIEIPEEQLVMALEGLIKSVCMACLMRPWKKYTALLERSNPLAMLILIRWSVLWY